MRPTNGAEGGYLKRPGPSGLADVIESILDKGIVIDAYVRVSLVGIELLTIDARIVMASVDTYLRFAEATNRLDLYEKGGKDLPEMIEGMPEGGAEGKTSGAYRKGEGGDHRGDDDGSSRTPAKEAASSSPPAQEVGTGPPRQDRGRRPEQAAMTPAGATSSASCRAGPSCPPSLHGLDERALTTILQGEIAAVAHTGRPRTRRLGTRVDLVAHSPVLDALAGLGPVIPVGFGSVMHDPSDVTEDLLGL